MSDSKTTHLPDKFTLDVEHRDGWWKITTKAHPGMYLLNPDLGAILADVPASLALLIKLDGANEVMADPKITTKDYEEIYGDVCAEWRERLREAAGHGALRYEAVASEAQAEIDRRMAE